MKKKAGVISIVLLLGIGSVAVAAYVMQNLPVEPPKAEMEQTEVRRMGESEEHIGLRRQVAEQSHDDASDHDRVAAQQNHTANGTSSITGVGQSAARMTGMQQPSSYGGSVSATPSSPSPSATPSVAESPQQSPMADSSTPQPPATSQPAVPPTVIPPELQPLMPTPTPAPPAPTPVPTPPAPQPQPTTNEEKAKRLLESLKSQKNDNVVQFTNDNGHIRTVLWTKGIAAPQLGAGGDFKKHQDVAGGGTYVQYYAPFRNDFLGSGWYDTDKTPGYNDTDRNLCYGAVAANQLHWWLHNNRQRIERFMTATDYTANLPAHQRGTLRDLTLYLNSFKGQQNSKLFAMFTAYFGRNEGGFQADPLIDLFINGYKPKAGGGTNDPSWPDAYVADDRGGFFHPVFERQILTRRLTTLSFEVFSRELKQALRDGKSVAIIHSTPGNYNHVITAWGAEYDLDGRLVGVYVTDSDDQSAVVNGMKRYDVNHHGGRAVLSTNITNPAYGPKIDSISILDLGDERWDAYLR